MFPDGSLSEEKALIVETSPGERDCPKSKENQKTAFLGILIFETFDLDVHVL